MFCRYESCSSRKFWVSILRRTWMGVEEPMFLLSSDVAVFILQNSLGLVFSSKKWHNWLQCSLNSYLAPKTFSLQWESDRKVYDCTMEYNRSAFTSRHSTVLLLGEWERDIIWNYHERYLKNGENTFHLKKLIWSNLKIFKLTCYYQELEFLMFLVGFY